MTALSRLPYARLPYADRGVFGWLCEPCYSRVRKTVGRV